jgi:hypothetical protein
MVARIRIAVQARHAGLEHIIQSTEAVVALPLRCSRLHVLTASPA